MSLAKISLAEAVSACGGEASVRSLDFALWPLDKTRTLDQVVQTFNSHGFEVIGLWKPEETGYRAGIWMRETNELGVPAA